MIFDHSASSLRKRFFIPVVWKIGFAILAVVALFGTINIILIHDRVTLALENEAERGALASVNSLVQQTVLPLLYRDNSSVQDLLDSVKDLDDRIAYAFVIDAEGVVTSHTFSTGIPERLVDPEFVQTVNSSGSVLIRSIQNPDALIRNVSLPIMHGRLGTLFMGLYEEDIGKNVNETINVFAWMVGLFLILGLAGAVLFARYLTKPVQLIADAADRIRLDTLSSKGHDSVRIRTYLTDRFGWASRVEDEMDTLTAHFNEMLSRLRTAYSDLETSREHIVQSEKMASIGTLAAGIAHEINNPIAGLKNCLRRIEKHPENMAQNIRYIEMMKEAADKIDTVVRGLLDFTRMKAMEREPVSVDYVIDKSLLLASYYLESSGVPVTREIEPGLPPVQADANQLEQVLLNLLINSIHAIESKRESHVGFAGSITVAAKKRKTTLQITVIDDGIGMDSTTIERIFDPFFTTKDTGKGTGLGLAVCRRIVEAHDGKVTVNSTPGEGATFSIDLPILSDGKVPSDPSSLVS